MSLTKWLRQSALVCRFAGPYSIDIQNHPYAKATTPDEIIAAAMIESFARDFDDWKLINRPDKFEINDLHSLSSWNNEDIFKTHSEMNKAHNNWKHSLLLPSEAKSKITKALVNEKKKLVLVWGEAKKPIVNVSPIGGIPRIEDRTARNWFHVNNTPIITSVGNNVVNSYLNLKKKIAEAEAAAAKAKAQMEANEKKWNLAEDLLGLKRNEFGALVPKVSVDETKVACYDVVESSENSITVINPRMERRKTSRCVGKDKAHMCYCPKCCTRVTTELD